MPQTIVFRRRESPSFWQRLNEAVRSYTVGPVSLATLKGEKLKEFFGEGYQTSAGVTVTTANAYTFSAVYDAVNQSSGDVGKIPLNFLIADKTNGGSQPNEKNPVYWLLKNEANPDMSAFEFKRTLQAHALTCKGGFAEIERDGMGRPAALWPITPERVQVAIRKTRLPSGRFRAELYYQLDGDPQHVLEARDVIHIKGLGYDGYCAYPVIDKARQTIGIGLAAQTFAGNFFGNNATFGGILTAMQNLDPEQAEQIRQQIEAVGKGPERAWRWLVLGSGFKYYPSGVNPQESQMDAVRDKQVEEVARFFNMPPYKLKMQKAGAVGYSSVEMFDLDYYKGHLLTWFTTWEQELNRKLVPQREWGNQYFKFNVNAFLRGDTAARTAMYTAMLDRGVFNADMVLDYEDLNPQPGGQGKMFLVQGAMVPKDKIEALVDATITKNTVPPPAPPSTDTAALQRQLQEAQERAAAAEQAATEARAQAEQETIARQDAEAAEATTSAERDALRAREATAVTTAAALETAAAQLRTEVQSLTDRIAAAAEAKRQEIESLNTILIASNQRVVELEQHATELEARADAAERDLSTEQGARQELASTLSTLRAEMTAAETAAQAAAADVNRQLEVERSTVADLQAQVAERFSEAAEARQALAAQQELVSVKDQEIEAIRSALSSVGQAKDETIRACEASIGGLERERQTALEKAATLAEQLTGAEQRATDADKALTAAQSLAKESAGAMVAALRTLALETMQRMVDREADRARGKGQQPEKLKAWIADFYPAHADYMRTALLPIVRLYLAFERSEADPIATTTALVEAHIMRSTTQLRGVVDERDLPSALHALVYRWTQERPAAFADDLLRELVDGRERGR